MLRQPVFVIVAALLVVSPAQARDLAAGTWELGGAFHGEQMKGSARASAPEGAASFQNVEWVRQDSGAAQVLYYTTKNLGLGVDWFATHSRGRVTTYDSVAGNSGHDAWERSRNAGPVLSWNVSAGDESSFKFYAATTSGEVKFSEQATTALHSKRFGIKFCDFVSKNASVDFGWSYAMNREQAINEPGPETKTNQWGLSLGLSVYIR